MMKKPEVRGAVEMQYSEIKKHPFYPHKMEVFHGDS